MQGLVYKSTGSWYLVKDKKNSFIECKLAGKLRNSDLKSTNPVCTGDFVNIKIDKNKTPVIESVLNRKNYIIRKSVKLSKQYQIIASNIDLCFLIITISRPLTSTVFIDRFLASNFAYNIDTCLLFNKIDDLDIEEKSKVDELFNLYSSIGYKCFKVSGKKLEIERKTAENYWNKYPYLFNKKLPLSKSIISNEVTKYSEADISKLKDLLNFQPDSKIEEGLKECFEYALKYFNL